MVSRRHRAMVLIAAVALAGCTSGRGDIAASTSFSSSAPSSQTSPPSATVGPSTPATVATPHAAVDRRTCLHQPSGAFRSALEPTRPVSPPQALGMAAATDQRAFGVVRTSSGPRTGAVELATGQFRDLHPVGRDGLGFAVAEAPGTSGASSGPPATRTPGACTRSIPAPGPTGCWRTRSSTAIRPEDSWRGPSSATARSPGLNPFRTPIRPPRSMSWISRPLDTQSSLAESSATRPTPGRGWCGRPKQLPGHLPSRPSMRAPSSRPPSSFLRSTGRHAT